MGLRFPVGVFVYWLTLQVERLKKPLLVALICPLFLMALSVDAQASLTWGGPTAVDPQAAGIALNRVSCPSVTQCTAVDGRGQEVTFNPQAPQNPTTVVLSSHTLSAINCPSTTQCTALDVTGEEVTFDPRSTAGGAAHEVDAGIPLGVICPALTQCTAVDANGQEVTFNPQSPGSPAAQSIDPNRILIAVVCPGASTTWCAAIDTTGEGVGFDPQGPLNTQGPTQLDTNNPQAASCAATQCALVDNAGAGVAFTVPDGQAPKTGSVGPIDQSNSGATSVNGVSCPSDSLCVGVDVKGAEETFNPKLPISGPVPIDSGQVLSDVSCPSQNQCTAVDRDGFEVTFDPGSPGHPQAAPVDGHTNLSSVSCPSTSQCTAVDVGGGEVTFTPNSSAAPSVAAVDSSNSGLYSVACPDTTLCAAVDGGGQLVTFNPQSPASPTTSGIDPGHSLYGLSCASSGQCTAVDDSGRELTFNPQAPGSPSARLIDSGHSLLSVSCPSTSQCTAVDDRGAEVTFAQSAPGAPRAYAIDRVPATALTCPATTQCTAVDGSGDEVTFNPLQPSQASALAVDAKSQLAAVVCRTVTDCVAVDQSGTAVEGDPRGTGAWSSHTISSASLAGVACPSVRECVAVDQPGNAFVGSSGPLPLVPGSLSAPAATGLVQQGQVLMVRHGRWSNDPTSYSYQWERCNAHGNRCVRLSGAASATYKLGRADVGHRIRVEEIAWNITGAGAARTSRATTIVGGSVTAHGSLSGVTRGRPRLGLMLRVGHGTTKLTRVVLVLPRGLSPQRKLGLALQSSGRRPSYTVTVRGRRITIALRRALSGLTVQAPNLSASRSLVRQARTQRARPLELLVTALQRDGGTTQLALAVLPR